MLGKKDIFQKIPKLRDLSSIFGGKKQPNVTVLKSAWISRLYVLILTMALPQRRVESGYIPACASCLIMASVKPVEIEHKGMHILGLK